MTGPHTSASGSPPEAKASNALSGPSLTQHAGNRSDLHRPTPPRITSMTIDDRTAHFGFRLATRGEGLECTLRSLTNTTRGKPIRSAPSDTATHHEHDHR